MFQERPWFYTAFSLLTLYALWLVWSPTYFVTGDGACHLYNAMVWKEMLLYKKSFYHLFYEFNPKISPNYTGHIFLAFLTTFFSPPIAEKILISTYILLLSLGWIRLSQALNLKRSPFLLLLFPLLFQVFLFTGFYNYLLGLAGFLLLFSYYLKKKSCLTQPRTLLVLSLFILLLYFVHVMGFLFFMMTMSVDVLLSISFQKQNRKVWIIPLLSSLLIASPAIVCFFLFSRTQTTADPAPYTSSFRQLFDELIQWKSMLIFHPSESSFLKGLFIFQYLSLTALTLSSLIKKTYSRSQQFLSLMLLLLAALYFFFPDNALGGEMIKWRFQTIIYLVLTLLLASYTINRFLHGTWLAIIFIFSFHHMNSLEHKIGEMSSVVKDIKKIEPLLENNAMILPLSFHTNGVLQGKEISQEVRYSTNHLGEYLYDGKKKMVFADNYEAHTNYFPLIWKPGTDPFPYLSLAESQPPVVDMLAYHAAYPIRYVLVFNLLPEDRHQKAWNELQHGLSPLYQKMAETERCILFRLNTKGLSD